MKHIGVVGAGIMASGMVRNFLKHGYAVSVWNRTSEQLASLVESGAERVGSPKAVAQAADIVIECVSDDDASRSVWLGNAGILAGADADTALITSASLSLDWTDELAGLCQQQGFKFLDIPLTGSRPGAEGGTLKLLAGGDQAVLDSIRTELGAISEKIYYFGPAGAGMRFKLLLNSLSAIQLKAAAQAMELARKAGLNPEQCFEAIMDGPMGPASPATKMLLAGMDQPDKLNFAVKWIEKDLRYAQAMADACGVDFDLLNDTQKDYQKAKDQGLGDRDWTSIFELYQGKGGEQ
jgi:3-hydroxyisobutyrate dehydrogenase